MPTIPNVVGDAHPTSLNKNPRILENPGVLMRMARLELARASHTPLKRACLPIPPHPQGVNALRQRETRITQVIQDGQALFC